MATKTKTKKTESEPLTSVWQLINRRVDPIGLHVETILGKLGTVKGLVRDEKSGFRYRLVIHHFDGTPWDDQPLPHLIYVIKPTYETQE